LVSGKLINTWLLSQPLEIVPRFERNTDGRDVATDYQGSVVKKTADERRSARANVMLVATVESGGVSRRLQVRNLSEHGALLSGDTHLDVDAEVSFRCNGVATNGWVAWIQPPYAGIQFAEPNEPEGLLRKSPETGRLITRDSRERNFRRPGFRGNQLTDEERRILEEWERTSSPRQ
jgi:hypothetical protein